MVQKSITRLCERLPKTSYPPSDPRTTTSPTTANTKRHIHRGEATFGELDNRDTWKSGIGTGSAHESGNCSNLDSTYETLADDQPGSLVTPAEKDLMNQDGGTEENNVDNPAVTTSEDARELVRLIQCPQCSRPFRNPVTLPCGNSLCKTCLPESHEREHISYPDLPGRRFGIQCPFANCGSEHPASDCSIDVVMSKIMDAIAEVVARYSSVVDSEPMLVDDAARYDEVMSSEPESEKPNVVTDISMGKLIATYKLAAQGLLDCKTDLVYPPETDATKAMDANVIQDVLEAAQKEVDCQVCYNVMLDPVTTYCGHTLCRKCMARVLDHSQHCPVCNPAFATTAT